MTERDQLIEEILDVALLALGTARGVEARRQALMFMNVVKSKRSPRQVQQLELDAMRRALDEESPTSP